MDKMSQFKEFVKNKPSLIKYVKDGDMTWQKFYELYDLYGSENEVWNDYNSKAEEKVNVAKETSFGLGEMLGWFKSMDLANVQTGINNMQRVLGVLQDFGGKKEETKPEYKPRPLYKHFED